ncbi:alpha/beta hydrolase [Chloroflexota bacterium]
MPSATPTPKKSDTPTLSPTATSLACWAKGGLFEYGSLSTELLRLPLDYRVYLPPCYEQQPERRYPVLYLIHGQSYTDDQWDRLGADEAADRLIAAGELPPFLIVMPRDRYGGQPSESNFALVIVEELTPLIDKDYRTLPGRRNRAVGGLSRGGGWAVHLALYYWETFGALGGHSPAIFYDDAQFMRVYLDKIPTASYPRIYIDIGDRDRPGLMGAAIWFEELLNEWDIPHEWYLYSGYHSEEYWSDHIEGYLRWYAQEW